MNGFIIKQLNNEQITQSCFEKYETNDKIYKKYCQYYFY